MNKYLLGWITLSCMAYISYIFTIICSDIFCAESYNLRKYVVPSPCIEKYCIYKRKEQYTVFILNLLFGWLGAGNWYMENNWDALIQLLSFIGMVVSFILGLFLLYIGGMSHHISMWFYIPWLVCALCFVATLGMWAMMIVQIGRNSIVDGNGIEMYPNMCLD